MPKPEDCAHPRDRLVAFGDPRLSEYGAECIGCDEVWYYDPPPDPEDADFDRADFGVEHIPEPVREAVMPIWQRHGL